MSEDCTYYLELMSQVIDGESSEEEDKELLRHVLQCTQCRSELAQLWEMHQTFSEFEEQKVPENFAQSVIDRIRADEASAVPLTTAPKRLQTKSNVIPLWKQPGVKALVSVAACAVVCIGLWRFAAPAQEPSQPDTGISSHSTAPINSTPINLTPIPKSLTAEPSSSQLSSDTRSDSQVVDMISETIEKAPGTILVLEKIPEDLEGQRYTTKNGDTILVPDTNDVTELLTQLPSPLMEIPGKDGPVVLVTLK